MFNHFSKKISMLKSAIIIWLSVLSVSLSAHQADISSTMLIERSPGNWVVQISSALTAFEYEVKTQYGENAFSTPEEFQALVIKHIRNGLAVKFNNKELRLINGSVKLGHETNVLFELEDFPSTIKTIGVSNTSFINIPRNQSALVVLRKDIPRKQYVLSAKNKHTISLGIENSGIVLLDKESTANNLPLQSASLLLATLFCLFCAGCFYFLKIRYDVFRRTAPILNRIDS